MNGERCECPLTSTEDFCKNGFDNASTTGFTYFVWGVTGRRQKTLLVRNTMHNLQSDDAVFATGTMVK